MFRSLLILLTLLLTPVIAVADDEKPLEPDTLLNWLRIIDMQSFRLLYAGDVNGYYFAVKMDKDGDILFCDYEHSKEKREDLRGFSIDVLDSNGKSLHDMSSEKKSPDTVNVTYRKDHSLGPLDMYSSVTVAYTRGVILPLKKHSETAVTVKYAETTKGNRHVLLLQRVPIPPKKTPSKLGG